MLDLITYILKLLRESRESVKVFAITATAVAAFLSVILDLDLTQWIQDDWMSWAHLIRYVAVMMAIGGLSYLALASDNIPEVCKRIDICTVRELYLVLQLVDQRRRPCEDHPALKALIRSGVIVQYGDEVELADEAYRYVVKHHRYFKKMYKKHS